MKNEQISQNSVNVLLREAQKRGWRLSDRIARGRNTEIFSDKSDVGVCYHVIPYSKEAVRQIFYARAAYRLYPDKFVRVELPDPEREMIYLDNSDKLREDCIDQEVEAVHTPDGDFLITMTERLSPVCVTSQEELLKVITDLADTLKVMYESLRFAIGTIFPKDIMYSNESDRYKLSGFSDISRFFDDTAEESHIADDSSPEFSDSIYPSLSSVYSLGTAIRMMIEKSNLSQKRSEGDSTEREKESLSPMDPAACKGLSPAVIRLINRMTAPLPEERPSFDDVIEAVEKLTETNFRKE